MTSNEYEQRLSGYFAGGMASLAIALARDTGIINILCEAKSPLTVEEIAEKGNLKNRYVTELLGALMAGKIITISEDSKTFHLLEDEKAILKKFAISCSFPTYLAERYNPLQECFKSEGPLGLSYGEYRAICGLLSSCKSAVINDIIDKDIIPAVPFMVSKLEAGCRVLEMGCNNGALTVQLAKRFPNSIFVGGDIVEKSLVEGRNTAKSMALTNVTFEEMNIMNFSKKYPESFDWVIAQDVIHDLSQPESAMAQINLSLKKGGCFSNIDPAPSGVAMAPRVGDMHALFYYTASTFACVPEAYQEVDAVAPGAMWGEVNIKAAIARAGFTLVDQLTSHRDHFVIHFVCQK